MTKTLKIFGIFLLSGVGIMFVWWTYFHSKYSQYLPEFTVIVDSEEPRYHLYVPEMFDAEPQDVLVFFKVALPGATGPGLCLSNNAKRSLQLNVGSFLRYL